MPKKKIKTKRSSNKKINPKQRSKSSPNRKDLIIFCIKFFAIFFTLTFLIDSIDLSSFTTFIAALTAGFLGLLSYGNLILVAGKGFIVSNDCTGLISASMLCAIVFSLRKPEIEQKIKLFVAGLLLLLAINIPRVIIVVYTAQLGLDADLVHIITWFLMSAIVLAIWYYGTKRVAKIKEFSELL